MPERPRTAPNQRKGGGFGSFGIVDHPNGGKQAGAFMVRTKKKKKKDVPAGIAKQLKKDLPFIYAGGTTLAKDAGGPQTIGRNASRPRRPEMTAAAMATVPAKTNKRPNTADAVMARGGSSSSSKSRAREESPAGGGAGEPRQEFPAEFMVTQAYDPSSEPQEQGQVQEVMQQTQEEPQQQEPRPQPQPEPQPELKMQKLFHRAPAKTKVAPTANRSATERPTTANAVMGGRPPKANPDDNVPTPQYHASPYDNEGLVRDPISHFISCEEAIATANRSRKVYYRYERPYSAAAGPLLDPDTGRPSTAGAANARAEQEKVAQKKKDEQEKGTEETRAAKLGGSDGRARDHRQRPHSAAALPTREYQKINDYPLAEGSSVMHSHAQQDLGFAYPRTVNNQGSTDENGHDVKKHKVMTKYEVKGGPLNRFIASEYSYYADGSTVIDEPLPQAGEELGRPSVESAVTPLPSGTFSEPATPVGILKRPSSSSTARGPVEMQVSIEVSHSKSQISSESRGSVLRPSTTEGLRTVPSSVLSKSNSSTLVYNQRGESASPTRMAADNVGLRADPWSLAHMGSVPEPWKPTARQLKQDLPPEARIRKKVRQAVALTREKREALMHASSGIPKWCKTLNEVWMPHDKLFTDLNHKSPEVNELDLSHWKLFDEDLAVVGAVSRALRCIRLNWCSDITDRGIVKLERFSKLTIFEANNCNKLSDRTIVHARKHFRRLETLHIDYCPLISQDPLRQILASSRHLTRLSVRGNPNVTDKVMIAIGEAMKKRRLLTALDLSGCCRFGNDAMLKMLEDGGNILKEFAISGCTNITDLGLIGLNREPGQWMNMLKLDLTKLRLHDSCISWVASGCRKLEELDVAGSRAITDAGWGCLQPLDRLRKVNFTDCVKLTRAGLKDMFESVGEDKFGDPIPGAGKEMRHLDFTRCTLLDDDGLTTVALNSPQLVTLVLTGVNQFSDAGLRAVARNCRCIEELDVSSDLNALELSCRSRIPQITAEGMAELAKYSSELRVLKLTNAVRISDEGFEALAAGCTRLETLDLRNCYNITDRTPAALGRHCHRLEELDLFGCLNVRDLGLQALAEGVPNMRTLVLSGIDHLTDEGVISVAERCPVLESVGLQNCKFLTDDSVLALASSLSCDTLKTLNLRSVGNLTDASVEALRSCTALTSVDLEFCDEVTKEAVKAVAEHLPFARVPFSHVGLQPLTRAVRLFNEVAIDRQKLAQATEIFQRGIRRHLAKKHYQLMRRKAIWAVTHMERVVRGFAARRRVAKAIAWARLSTTNAAQIQRTWRWYSSNQINKALQKQRYRRRLASESVQRMYRCWSARRKVRGARRIYERIMTRWERIYVSWKELLLERKIVGVVIRLQRSTRRRIRFLRDEAFKAVVPSVQRAWRCYVARCEREHRMEIKYAVERKAGRQLLRAWRLKKEWEVIIRRVRKDEEQWRIDKDRHAWAMKQLFYYIMRMNLMRRARKALMQKKAEREASFVVVRFFRAAAAKNIVKRIKKRKAVRMMKWASLARGLLDVRLHRAARVIQRGWQKRLYNLKRDQAAQLLQRAYRGLKGRRNFFSAILHMRDDMQVRIAGAFRAYMARTVLKRILWLRRRSAGMIARAWLRKAEWMVLKAYIRHEYALREADIRKQKEVMMTNRREEFARELLAKGENKRVQKIQMAFRKHLKKREEKRKRMRQKEAAYRKEFEEIARRIDAERHAHDKQEKIKTSKPMFGGQTDQERMIETKATKIRSEIGAKKEDNANFIEKFTRKFGDNRTPQERREEGQVMAASILNRQTRSTILEGITGIKFTVGLGEYQEMLELQKHNKLTHDPIYEVMKKENSIKPLDLCANKKKKIYFWTTYSTGKWVWTGVQVMKAPPNHANPSKEKARRGAAAIVGQVICGHPQLDIEITGYAARAVGEASPGIDKIALAFNEEDVAALEKKDYTKVIPHFGKFGLAKGLFLMIHHKKLNTQPILHKIVEHLFADREWFDNDLEDKIEGYVLAADDVLTLHKFFKSMDITREGAIDILQIFNLIGEKITRYAPWLTDLVDARGTNKLIFSEFVALVCGICCMGKAELARWAFFNMDREKRGSLDENEFMHAAEILLENEPTPVAMGKVKRLFHIHAKDEKIKDARGLDTGERVATIYFDEFAVLADGFLPLLWPLYRLQDKLRFHTLGREYWEAKMKALMGARKKMRVFKENKETLSHGRY